MRLYTRSTNRGMRALRKLFAAACCILVSYKPLARGSRFCPHLPHAAECRGASSLRPSFDIIDRELRQARHTRPQLIDHSKYFDLGETVVAVDLERLAVSGSTDIAGCSRDYERPDVPKPPSHLTICVRAARAPKPVIWLCNAKLSRVWVPSGRDSDSAITKDSSGITRIAFGAA